MEIRLHSLQAGYLRQRDGVAAFYLYCASAQWFPRNQYHHAAGGG